MTIAARLFGLFIMAMSTIGTSVTFVHAAQPRIGLFDVQATGGQGVRVDGLIEGLNSLGYDVHRFSNFQPLTLALFDIIYLSDMHNPGNVDKQWRKHLAAYVRAGGSVLQTWHHHVFPEISVGVRRAYGQRQMHVHAGHAAVDGMPDFRCSFKDHIIERVGPNGTVLIENDNAQPVAVAGKLGKGKVISTGIALAIPGGNATATPRGSEARLLKGFLSWLEPNVPRQQRIATMIHKPQLCVSPNRILAVAGSEVTFQATVGAPGTVDIQLICDGAMVQRDDAPEHDALTSTATIRTFRITTSTQRHTNSRKQLVVRARMGNVEVTQTVDVEGIFAEPPADEIRGVWLHVGMDRRPQIVMPELKQLGINTVVLRIAGGTAAFYASKVQPDVQDPLAPDGDWLAEAVEHAHANGIKLHPYVNNCVVEGRTSPESLTRLRSAGRLQEDANGNPIDWFCPSQEVNRDAIARPMIEIVSNYPVDGIQYDFIRYPGANGCFCAKCRTCFENETGHKVANWPADCIDGPRHAQWVEFRCDRISALVKYISTKIRLINPDVKISAAVFRDWPQCRENNGQDWVRWCREGWLDFVCPMNYTLDPVLFAERARIHRQALPKGFPIVQGIGIASGQGRMHTANELAVQIMLARKAHAAGFVGFAYQAKHTASLFAPLKRMLQKP